MIPEKCIIKGFADKLWKITNKISDLIRKGEPIEISNERIIFRGEKPSRKKLYKLFKKQHALIKDLLNSI